MAPSTRWMPLLCVACIAAPAQAFGYGETVDDRPSPHERAVHFFTDELRVDPGEHDSQFDREALRPLVYQSTLNDAARFYADYLPAGRYHLSYTAQAIAPGEFTVLPLRAEEMYDPDVYGRGLPGRLHIESPER